jgi:multiple sugar transport system permease protein
MDTTVTTYTQPVEKPNRWTYLLDSERFLGAAMLMPAFVYILLLVGIPFVLAILFSFSDITVGSPQIDRLTFETFQRVLNDRNFQRALSNNLFFTIASQLIILVLATTLALALTRSFHGKWLVRLLSLLPWATPVAVGAITWLWLYDNVWSPIDYIFRQVHLLGPGGLIRNTTNMYWLSDPTLAMWSIVVVHVWRMLPMSTVIIMAGITSISPDVKDAVAVDGAGFWQELWDVTLPLIRPITLVALLFGIIFTFTDMTVVYVLTKGSSNTHVLASLAFQKGIEASNLAEGAATVVFMLPVLLGVAMLMLRLARRTEVR